MSAGGQAVTTTGSGKHARWLTFAAGFFGMLVAVLLVGEAIARLALPQDIRLAIGPDPKQAKIYKPDPLIGADFRSYEEFRQQNADLLEKLGPLNSPKPTWLLFGNSFVQGTGHLADTAERALPDVRIFALRKFADLPLRAAEARQLLSQGLRPERILFVMLPIDTLQVGRRPLSFIEVHTDGALATKVRWPNPPWGSVVKSSRLATIAWIRSGRSAGDPSFDQRRLNVAPPQRVQDDLLRIFTHLAETSRRYNVPVTVVALPDRAQILGQAGFGFQETLAALTKRAGIDFVDVHKPFVEATDKRTLFVPDWHLSERGNAMLLQELLAYMKGHAAKTSTGS